MEPKFERITDQNGNIIGQRQYYDDGSIGMRLLDHEGNYTPWEDEALPEDASQQHFEEPIRLIRPVDSDLRNPKEEADLTPEMAADMMRDKEEDWNAKIAAQELSEDVREEIDMHLPGAKDDADKQLSALVLSGFSGALQEVIKVGTFGANKYTPNGWMHVPDAHDRYQNAAMRHWLKAMDGNRFNEEDGNVRHLAQIIWNLCAVLEFELAEEQVQAVESQ